MTLATRNFGAVLGLALVTVSPRVQAHVRLDVPTPRYPAPTPEDGSNLKVGPCGADLDSRTTDPSRITSFVAGSTITVKFHESIHHESHYRIAFDLDGQDDLPSPASATDIVEPPEFPILLDGIPDKSPSADSYSVEVKLPSQACEKCTLQLIQYMYNRPDPLYFQCADVRLVESLEGLGGSSGVVGLPSTGGDGGGARGSGGVPSSGGAALDTETRSSGCSSHPHAPPSSSAPLILLALAPLALRRARTRTTEE